MGHKQTHWDIHDGGTFRPGDWEALLAKKKRERGKPQTFLPLPSERMGSGAPISAVRRPLVPPVLRG